MDNWIHRIEHSSCWTVLNICLLEICCCIILHRIVSTFKRVISTMDLTIVTHSATFSLVFGMSIKTSSFYSRQWAFRITTHKILLLLMLNLKLSFNLGSLAAWVLYLLPPKFGDWYVFNALAKKEKKQLYGLKIGPLTKRIWMLRIQDCDCVLCVFLMGSHLYYRMSSTPIEEIWIWWLLAVDLLIFYIWHRLLSLAKLASIKIEVR